VVLMLVCSANLCSCVTITTATRVYGQLGRNFTSNTTNNGGISADSLFNPFGLAVDNTGNVFIVDQNNNRLLFYMGINTTATRVYGQGGGFTTGVPNNGVGASRKGLSAPTGVAIDNSNNVYIADRFNHRVLFYSGTNTTASRVYGQLGVFTSNTPNNGGISANTLNFPGDVAVDDSNNVYIVDRTNSRVLIYSGTNTTASRVYGQLGSFTSDIANNGGISANTLNLPYGIVVDNSNNLYIVDSSNHRVLFYNGANTTASRVYGQLGSFTSNAVNNGGISANGLNSPFGLAADRSNNVFIVDRLNNRVLFYTGTSTTATRVYGQGGSFTTNTQNNGGVSADSLDHPRGVAIDLSNNVFIVDHLNDRVLFYLGQSDPPSCELTPPCSCVGNLCTYTNPITISSPVTITTQIIIQNNLNVTSSGVISLSSGASITVAGTVSLSGILNLVNVNQTGSVTVISSTQSLNGMFESVTFTNSSVDNCDKLKGTQSLSNNALSILVEVNCGLSTGALIGIIIGSV